MRNYYLKVFSVLGNKCVSSFYLEEGSGSVLLALSKSKICQPLKRKFTETVEEISYRKPFSLNR